MAIAENALEIASLRTASSKVSSKFTSRSRVFTLRRNEWVVKISPLSAVNKRKLSPYAKVQAHFQERLGKNAQMWTFPWKINELEAKAKQKRSRMSKSVAGRGQKISPRSFDTWIELWSWSRKRFVIELQADFFFSWAELMRPVLGLEATSSSCHSVYIEKYHSNRSSPYKSKQNVFAACNWKVLMAKLMNHAVSVTRTH